MGRPRGELCERYEQGESVDDFDLAAGGCYAAVTCTKLPDAVEQEDHIVRRGYAVGVGSWFFFTAIEPAVAFGRAARMSYECRAYAVHDAAYETRYWGCR